MSADRVERVAADRRDGDDQQHAGARRGLHLDAVIRRLGLLIAQALLKLDEAGRAADGVERRNEH